MIYESLHNLWYGSVSTNTTEQTDYSFPGSGVAPPARSLRDAGYFPGFINTPADLLPRGQFNGEAVSRAILPPPALYCYQQGAPGHNSPGNTKTKQAN